MKTLVNICGKPPKHIVMPTHHFRDRTLSLNAMGLMSVLLSEPATNGRSFSDIVELSNSSSRTVRSAVIELEIAGYLEKDASGIYKVFSMPRKNVN